jgi:hypothetical protein
MGGGGVSHQCYHYLSTLFASTINPISITDVFQPILKHDIKLIMLDMEIYVSEGPVQDMDC